MRFRDKYFRVIILLATAILTLVNVTGCSNSDKDLLELYNKAIEDASVAEPDEISRDLEAIVSYNTDLVWEGSPGTSDVLLLTWAGDFYNDKVNQTILTEREIWVVIPGELKEFFHQNTSLSGDKLILRLEQLYGIKPNSNKQWFVEIWASPDDIFRPSPDPGITDHEAELDFPKWVDTEYMSWFNTKKNDSYTRDSGFPWTRLGYTYDWGNPKDEVGLSEFIIKEGSMIEIHSVTRTLEYSKND